MQAGTPRVLLPYSSTGGFQSVDAWLRRRERGPVTASTERVELSRTSPLRAGQRRAASRTASRASRLSISRCTAASSASMPRARAPRPASGALRHGGGQEDLHLGVGKYGAAGQSRPSATTPPAAPMRHFARRAGPRAPRQPDLRRALADLGRGSRCSRHGRRSRASCRWPRTRAAARAPGRRAGARPHPRGPASPRHRRCARRAASSPRRHGAIRGAGVEVGEAGRSATVRLTVLLPAPAGPSMVTTGRRARSLPPRRSAVSVSRKPGSDTAIASAPRIVTGADATTPRRRSHRDAVIGVALDGAAAETSAVHDHAVRALLDRDAERAQPTAIAAMRSLSSRAAPRRRRSASFRSPPPPRPPAPGTRRSRAASRLRDHRCVQRCRLDDRDPRPAPRPATAPDAR